jgi:hypothetical protein
MTTRPLKRGATYDDLRDVPDHFVAEICDGISALFAEIHKAFHRTSRK